MSLSVIKSYNELQEFLPAWDNLVTNAVESNPFYESWSLGQAVKSFGEKANLNFILITADDSGKLIGFFPFVKKYFFHKLPLFHFALWQYPQDYLCTPLIDKNYTRECFAALFGWVKSQHAACLVRLNLIRGDGPFYQALKNYLKEANGKYDETYFSRAMIDSNIPVDEYFKQSMSTNSRHEMRRKHNNLEKQGEVKYHDLTPESDLNYWLDNLLELENAGWKGRMGTALKALPGQEEFYREMCRSAFSRGRLMAQMLTLNEKPIAILAEFNSQNEIFGIKTVYDENFSKFSPSAQLIMKAGGGFLSAHEKTTFDSCAEPDQTTFNRLFSERRTIRHVNLATANPLSHLLTFCMTNFRTKKK